MVFIFNFEIGYSWYSVIMILNVVCIKLENVDW